MSSDFDKFRKLIRLRLKEANLLLAAHEYSGSYYIAGYAIEFAFKAHIVRNKISRNNLPAKDFIRSVYTHNLGELLGLSDLTKDHKDQSLINANFANNWQIVKQWSETARYEIKQREDAEKLIKAISSRDGEF